MRTRNARLSDAGRIHDLIADYARQQILLPRSLAEIRQHIGDFTVVESRGEVIGCAALHRHGLDWSEIRSVAVARPRQRRGVGGRLVKALLAEAEQRRVSGVCLFTCIPEYFARSGFVPVAPRSLPEKAWKDWLKCPRTNGREKVAMVFAGLPAWAAPRRKSASVLGCLPE